MTCRNSPARKRWALRGEKPASDVDTISVRETYEGAAARARQDLREAFDREILEMEKRVSDQRKYAASRLSRLKEEKAAFESARRRPLVASDADANS